VSKAFWDRLREVLRGIERSVAIWCACELGESIDGLGSSLLAFDNTNASGMLDGAGPPGATWLTKWDGRLEEFYGRTADLATALSSADVLKLCGPLATLDLTELRRAYSNLNSVNVAPYLRLAAIAVLPHSDSVSYISTYSPQDLLPIAPSLLEHLDTFDGRRPTREVIDVIAERSGTEFVDEIVKRLTDFGVLVSVPELNATETGHRE
jgi:hypothetical protein